MLGVSLPPYIYNLILFRKAAISRRCHLLSVFCSEPFVLCRRFVIRSCLEADGRSVWCLVPGCIVGVTLTKDRSNNGTGTA